MGLAERLDYQHRSPNPIQKAFKAVASTRAGAKLFAMILHHLDSATATATNRRSTVTSWLASLEVIWVTTTGARSGRPRQAPLVAVPVGDGLAVVGTGWGLQSTPGWVYNLLADPRAEVEYRGRRVPVMARVAFESEAKEVWDRILEAHAGYAQYAKRVTDRPIRVFILSGR